MSKQSKQSTKSSPSQEYPRSGCRTHAGRNGSRKLGRRTYRRESGKTSSTPAQKINRKMNKIGGESRSRQAWALCRVTYIPWRVWGGNEPRTARPRTALELVQNDGSVAVHVTADRDVRVAAGANAGELRALRVAVLDLDMGIRVQPQTAANRGKGQRTAPPVRACG